MSPHVCYIIIGCEYNFTLRTLSGINVLTRVTSLGSSVTLHSFSLSCRGCRVVSELRLSDFTPGCKRRQIQHYLRDITPRIWYFFKMPMEGQILSKKLPMYRGSETQPAIVLQYRCRTAQYFDITYKTCTMSLTLFMVMIKKYKYLY